MITRSNCARTGLALLLGLSGLPPPALADTATLVQPKGFPHICANNYPYKSIRKGQQGKVKLAFHVTPQGTVSDVTVKQSSGYDLLDQAAVACASKWTYQPATKDGQPIQVDWAAEVDWALPDNPNIVLTTMPYSFNEPYECNKRPDDTIGVHGETIVFFTVKSSDGKPQDLVVEKSSGNAALDSYAVSCVSSWHYFPATRAGKAISMEWYARLKW